jgi:histidine ammonia-lyase
MVLKDRHMLISGGNFHGEYPAKALDYLAIGVQELANISERRIERLVNCAYSEGLPSFLVLDGGINSGFMIAHVKLKNFFFKWRNSLNRKDFIIFC